MKPGIVAAVLLAGFTGMVLAERDWPQAATALICLTALFLAASGSAMLNSLLDARLDRRMARLQARVAALETAGRTRVLVLALTVIGISLILSLRSLGLLPFLLILTAALSYTLLYTLRLKRRSPWGVIPGGIPGALPVLVGYSAAAHGIRLDGMLLFLVMLLWQPPHFWTLALEYRRDYLAAGVPVLPVTHGERFTKALIFIHLALLIPATLALYLCGFCSPWYGLVALAGGIALLAACRFFLIKRERFALAFNASIFYLILILASIIADICLIRGRMA